MYHLSSGTCCSFPRPFIEVSLPEGRLINLFQEVVPEPPVSATCSGMLRSLREREGKHGADAASEATEAATSSKRASDPPHTSEGPGRAPRL